MTGWADAAAKLVGNTPSPLNNEGYSYMLRGDLEEKANKLSVRMILPPALGIFPVILILILFPAMLKLVQVMGG